jgi:hypothetical protein
MTTTSDKLAEALRAAHEWNMNVLDGYGGSQIQKHILSALTLYEQEKESGGGDKREWNKWSQDSQSAPFREELKQKLESPSANQQQGEEIIVPDNIKLEALIIETGERLPVHRLDWSINTNWDCSINGIRVWEGGQDIYYYKGQFKLYNVTKNGFSEHPESQSPSAP